jgi:hypothetical protein
MTQVNPYIQGAPKKTIILPFFGVIFGRKIFFLKTSFLGVKLAEKHDSGVKKIF